MANATRDNKIPVSFNLPDGDVVELITWDFVEDKLDRELAQTLNQIDAINVQLGRIESRIDEWLAEQS